MNSDIPVNYIDSNEDLTRITRLLSTLPYAAVDLEFDKNRFRYGFNLCLVQIATSDQCFLIDPLAKGMDISLIFPFFEDPAIQKIAFAFNEDLRLLHSLECFPKNIYDLSIASKLLNYPPLSLKNLLKELLDIEVNKSSQTSNWFKRPLADVQLNYAALDVLHLVQLKDALISNPSYHLLKDWINEENAFFETISYADEENALPYKRKDKAGLTQYEWHIYKYLLLFRENLAEKSKRPSYQIMDKNYLRDAARSVSAGRGWEKKWGFSKPYNTDTNRHLLKEEIDKAKQEANALGLSKRIKAIPPQTREEAALAREERDRKDEIKRIYFDPIKAEISERYGEEAATFILSNKLIMKLIDEGCEDLLSYKKKLLMKIGEELDINLEPIVSVT